MQFPTGERARRRPIGKLFKFLAEIAETGRLLPGAVQRQFAIQDIIGEEVGPAVNGDKTVDEALGSAESPIINDLLANL